MIGAYFQIVDYRSYKHMESFNSRPSKAMWTQVWIVKSPYQGKYLHMESISQSAITLLPTKTNQFATHIIHTFSCELCKEKVEIFNHPCSFETCEVNALE